MKNVRFHQDLQHSFLEFGHEKLTAILGISSKTLGRYLQQETNPQPRMLMNFYQKLYHYSQKIYPQSKAELPSLQEYLLIDICLYKMNINDIEKNYGQKGKAVCASMIKKNMIFLCDDLYLSVSHKHPELPTNIINILGKIIANDTRRPEHCEFHTIHLSPAGKNKLLEIMRELGNKISLLRNKEEYSGNDPVLVSTLARTFTFIMS